MPPASASRSRTSASPASPTPGLFEQVAAIAGRAESAGFDTLFVMDHFYQLPALGAPDQPMLEAYTLLGALAARTKRARLATLVTGNTYRNPALLAKIVTTLDVISGGRAMLGIGAGWFEPEHVGYGFDFPPIRERLDRARRGALDHRARCSAARSRRSNGRYYRAHEALNSRRRCAPGGPPILIGGSGEKRTLRLVAKYARREQPDLRAAEIPRKLEALAGHCCDARARSALDRQELARLVHPRAHRTSRPRRARNEFLARRGMNWNSLPEPVREIVNRALVLGDPDTVGERVQREILEPGLDGIVVNLPADAHVEGAVERAAATLRKALG